MEGEADDAGALELAEELLGQGEPVGVDYRLEALARDELDDLHDLGVHERIATRDRHAVHGAQALEDREVCAHLIERLVSARIVLAVTTEAGEVALLRRLEPGDRVVGQRPR